VVCGHLTSYQPSVNARSPDWNGRHLAALVVANLVLAMGPWFVRVADTGPVAAGFWRLALFLPLLFLLARIRRQPLGGFSPKLWIVVIGAGGFFALDLAAWHVGIGLTRLGNASLFGNSGSLILMIWGMIAARRAPSRHAGLAVLAAFSGAAILFGRSLEISHETMVGDLFSLLAGFFYTFYILLLQGARSHSGNWALLGWSSLAGAPVMLAIALALGEQIWPQAWWPLVALALGSQVIGQGLLVYALRHFPPLMIGIALLIQPVVGAVYGWAIFGEALTALDLVGMALVGAALVIARAGER